MEYGPVDLLVIRFSDNTFTGRVVDELKALVDANTVRILDLMLVSKGEDGTITTLELSDLDDPVARRFDDFVGEIEALLAPDDALAIGSGLAPDSSAGLVLYENVWARAFASAVEEVGGEVIMSERIPRDTVNAMHAEIDATA